MPPKHRCGDDEFISLFRALGSPTLVANQLGISSRNVLDRRREIESRYQISLPTTNDLRGAPLTKQNFLRTQERAVKDGTVVFFTDPHWLPDHSSAMQDGLLTVLKMVHPVGIICGGDALDGTQISKWEPTRGHHKSYTVREQLDCMTDHFDEIREASPGAWFDWILGNHDTRLSKYVAVNSPEILDLPNTRLEDWIKGWPISWRVDINKGKPGMTVLRHRPLGGMLHLQAQKAGCHYIHGHVHKLNAHRLATFRGVAYSVDGGSMADPSSDAFDYAEGAPDHQQGFAVLTYNNYRLMPPEFCELIDGKPWFRGAFI